MEKQFKRFLELSLKFTKTKSEVLGEFPMESYSVNFGQLTTSGQISFLTASGGSEIKQKSTADLIREEAEKKAVLADEYEEYLELQKNLGEYFRVTEKLNN